MIPLSGYLSRLWGTQKVFLSRCAGFVIMSVATGLSSSVEMMIFFRALQGFVGGAMIPTVFAVAFTAFPPDQARHGQRHHGPDRDPGPDRRPDPGRPPDRVAELALAVLHQRAVRACWSCSWSGRYANFDKGDPSLAKGFDWSGLGLMADLPDEPAVRAGGGLQERLVRRRP